MPLESPKADSAVLNWPCESAADCSYNGKCAAAGVAATLGSGGCACEPAWQGVRCGELALLPVDKYCREEWGFREVASDGSNVSTWGSPILYDETGGKWHGWASEMMHGCGINAWETNSQIVHLVGDGPSGPFTRQNVFAPPFAHEPDVVRGPKGEWVMTYSAYNSETLALGLRKLASHLLLLVIPRPVLTDCLAISGGYNASALAAVVCTNCTNGASPPAGSP